jgi:CheY-like chemotaxis protein
MSVIGIIEDSEIVRDLLTDVLESRGHTCSTSRRPATSSSTTRPRSS